MAACSDVSRCRKGMYLQGWVAFAVALLLRPGQERRQMSPSQQWQLTAQLLHILQQALLPHWHLSATSGAAFESQLAASLVQSGQLPQLLASSLPPHAGESITACLCCERLMRQQKLKSVAVSLMPSFPHAGTFCYHRPSQRHGICRCSA